MHIRTLGCFHIHAYSQMLTFAGVEMFCFNNVLGNLLFIVCHTLFYGLKDRFKGTLIPVCFRCDGEVVLLLYHVSRSITHLDSVSCFCFFREKVAQQFLHSSIAFPVTTLRPRSYEPISSPLDFRIQLTPTEWAATGRSTQVGQRAEKNNRRKIVANKSF